MSWRLKVAEDADSADIIDFIRTVWSEYPGKTLSIADMPELMTPKTSYEGRFWTVKDSRGGIVGTVALKITSDAAELQKLYVAKVARRQGLGEFLIRLVEEEASRLGFKELILWSDVRLLDAHKAYERLKYAHEGATRVYDDTDTTIRRLYKKSLPDRECVRFLSMTAHPRSVGESYFEHMAFAFKFGSTLLFSGLACFTHGLFPFLFKTTGSDTVFRLHKNLSEGRRSFARRAMTWKSESLHS